MKLKLKIAKLDEVAEAYRGLYEARDGAFVLKDEFEIADPVDVTGLTKNRDTILAEKTALEQKFAGIDPEKAREALKKVEELPAKEKTEGDRVAALEKQMADEKVARLAADERANLQFIRSAATSAISAAKGRAGADILLMPHILGDPDSGRPRRAAVVAGSLQILAEDGKTPMLDDKGAPATMAGLIDSFKKQDIFGPVFEATGVGGSGAPGGNSGAVNGGQVRTVLANDQAAIDSNLSGIADGSVVVTGQ
jgi:hypothetical protein